MILIFNSYKIMKSDSSVRITFMIDEADINILSTLMPNDHVILKSQLSGEMRGIYQSDFVKKNDIYIEIDVPEFNYKKAKLWSLQESSKISNDIPLEKISLFKEKTDIVNSSLKEEKPEKEKSYAYQLHKKSFFIIRQVLEILGTEKDMKVWLFENHDKCCCCKSPATDAHHVNRNNDCHGIGLKSTYRLIPVCRRCHNILHNQSEIHLLSHLCIGIDFDIIRMKYCREWAIYAFKDIFNVDSLATVSKDDFVEWCDSYSLTKYLP